MDKYVTHRQDLCAERQALLPTDPTREIELTETDLEVIYGGAGLTDWLGLSNPAVSFNPDISFNPAASASPAASANPTIYTDPTGSFNPTVSANPQGLSDPRIFANFWAN